MIIKKLRLLLLPLFVALSLGAQDVESININETLLLAGIAAGSYDPVAIPARPLNSFILLGYRLPVKNPDEPVRAGFLARILAQFFDVPGGIFYHIFPSPHYALKELQNLGILSEDYNDRDIVSRDVVVQSIQDMQELLTAGDLR